jgi:hypothetical protein
MYSLAVLVAVIFSAMLFSGPLAIGLTFIRVKKPVSIIIRRVGVSFLSAIGISLGVLLIVETVALGAKVFALVAIAACTYALKREFKRG